MALEEEIAELNQRKEAVIRKLAERKQELRLEIASIDDQLRSLGAKNYVTAKKAPTGAVTDKIEALIKKEPGSTPGEIAEELGLSKSQVYNAISRLVSQSRIVRGGSERARSYFPADE